jgi:hypothetical protein
VPLAGIWKGASISKIASGSPIVQPSTKAGSFGRSLLSPLGAPPSTHARIVAISLSDKRGSFLKTPCSASAPHGGMVRVATRLRIDLAHGRASSNFTSDMGANIVGRWHSTHFE